VGMKVSACIWIENSTYKKEIEKALRFSYEDQRSTY